MPRKKSRKSRAMEGCTRTCHTQGLTPVSRLDIGGCGCLVPGIFPGPQADWTPLRPPPLDFLYFFLGISILNTYKLPYIF